MDIRGFHIHGDNIVECERFLNLLTPILIKRGFVQNGSINSFICPKYTFTKNDTSMYFQFLPGFNSSSKKKDNKKKRRWDNNILDIIKQRGGPLREAADIFLTEIVDSQELPIVAIEYCSALQAGNQAWQRSGRSYSYGKAKIPLLYVVDIGGYELSEARDRIATRLPSPTVPFSYVSFSMLNNVQVSQIFTSNSGTSDLIKSKYKDIFGQKELKDFVEQILFGLPKTKTINKIQEKQLSFVIESAKEKDKRKFNKKQWQDFFDVISKNGNVMNFLETEGVPNWNKKVSIDRTTSFKQHLESAKSLCLGITQNDLPFCLLPSSKRVQYTQKLSQIYDTKLSNDFYKWLSTSEKPLVLCWVAGFKPRGDDSRPDRGLLPLCRMLLGDEVEIITIIYGPLTDTSFKNLTHSPTSLQSNGLWQAVFDGSNALIIDSLTTADSTNISFLKNHWQGKPNKEVAVNDLGSMPYTNPYPLIFSENDVDSLIHNFFKKYQENDVCYEVMCNPPGGDWSGMSYFDAIKNTELRWLTLPRIGNRENKRPDHIIQIHDDTNSFLLSIESKEIPNTIEDNIGNRLNWYVEALMATECSSSRDLEKNIWTNEAISIDLSSSIFASGIAFLGDNSPNSPSPSKKAIAKAEERSNSDISFTVDFPNGVEELQIKPLTQTGRDILKILEDNIGAVSSPFLTIRFLK